MRCCQLCGCTSWGGLGNPADLKRLQEFVGGVETIDAGAYARCDNCLSVARRSFLEEPAREVPAASLMPNPATIAREMFGTLPSPPTRLERLVSAMLKGGLGAGSSGEDVVSFARELETELDVAEFGTPVPEVQAKSSPAWLALSWPAREEFERWLTGLLDAMNVAGKLSGEYEYLDVWYERAVSYATKA